MKSTDGRPPKIALNRQYDYRNDDFSPVSPAKNGKAVGFEPITKANQGSKSEYQFPIGNHKFGAADWDDRKSR